MQWILLPATLPSGLVDVAENLIQKQSIYFLKNLANWCRLQNRQKAESWGNLLRPIWQQLSCSLFAIVGHDLARWEDRSTQPLPMPGAGTPQNEKSECGASYPAPRSPPPPAAIRTTLNCSQETMIQYDSVWFSTFYWDLKPGLRKKLTLTHDHPLLIQSKEEKHIAFEWPSQEFRFY